MAKGKPKRYNDRAKEADKIVKAIVWAMRREISGGEDAPYLRRNELLKKHIRPDEDLQHLGKEIFGALYRADISRLRYSGAAHRLGDADDLDLKSSQALERIGLLHQVANRFENLVLFELGGIATNFVLIASKKKI